MFSTAVVHILLSTASIYKWRLTKIDMKAALLQTGVAERDIYVIALRKSASHSKVLWVLLTAAYGLINANAKWKVHSDALLGELRFIAVKLRPKLLILPDASSTSQSAALLAKIVDEILISRPIKAPDNISWSLHDRFPLGPIVHSPAVLLFFVLRVTDLEDYTIAIDGDYKVDALVCLPLSHLLRKAFSDPITPIEQKAFTSVNCSVGWLGIPAFPFYSAFSSRKQQVAVHTTVSDLIA